jgi:hypothetical protein
VTREQQGDWLALTAAVVAPLSAAAALIPFRHQLDNTNVALVLVVVVVAAATLGRRFAAAVAALSSAVWFDFFHTQPYYSFLIRNRDDAVTAGLLLVVGVAGELRDILSLRDCRFEYYTAADKPIARIERNGEVTVGQLRWGVATMGLPTKEVELLIEGGGRPLGRFVLTPTSGKPIPFDKRLVAVALADQVGAALATTQPV